MDFDSCRLPNSYHCNLVKATVFHWNRVRLKIRSYIKVDKEIQETCKFSLCYIFICKK